MLYRSPLVRSSHSRLNLQAQLMRGRLQVLDLTFCGTAVGLLGLIRAPTSVTCGSKSCSRPSFFALRSLKARYTPVILPPGELRLATRPILTGSSPLVKTIGIVDVAALAARAAGGPLATITATRRLTKSA